MYVIVDDQIVEKKQAKISIFDRAVLWGDGVFTTLLVENGKPIFFDAHQKRLHEHAKGLNIKAPFIDRKLIEQLIQKNKATTGLFRLKIFVTGGTGPGKLFAKREAGSVFSFLEPYEGKKKTLRVGLYPNLVETPTAHFKTLTYLYRFALMDWAEKNGFDDCILTSGEGYVLEGVFANLFWYKEPTFYFPDPILPLMHGITIQLLHQLVEELGLEAKPVKAKVEDLPEDAALFLTNSLMGFSPIASFNNKACKRHASFEKKLMNAFDRFKQIF